MSDSYLSRCCLAVLGMLDICVCGAPRAVRAVLLDLSLNLPRSSSVFLMSYSCLGVSQEVGVVERAEL